MKIINKLNSIFRLDKVKEAEGAKVWIVSWDARFGRYYNDKGRKAKAFLSYEDAGLFAKSLREAQGLLEYTENINITIEEQK